MVHLNSERIYWFHSPEWFGPAFPETVVISLFYGAALGLAIWGLGRVAFQGLPQVILAGAVFGWTVEGVLVYVLHEAGPLDPIFPAMFAGWHGMLSFVGLFYLVRKLLIERRTKRLAVLASLYGIYVGVWASFAYLPEAYADSIDSPVGLGPATPGEYALTVLLVGVTLGVAHLLLDRLWPTGWIPSRLSTWVIVGGTAVWAALGFFAVPYGPVRYLALVAVALWAMRRSGKPSPETPGFFAALAGSVRATDLWALLPGVVGAAGAYALVSGYSLTTLSAINELHVFSQVLLGATGVGWAIWRLLRRPLGESAQSPSMASQS